MKINSFKLICCLLSFFALIILFQESFGQNKSTTNSNKSTNTKADEKRRVEIQKLLLNGEYQHDGSGELISIGTIDSVPALLKVLADNPPKIQKIVEDDDAPVLRDPNEIVTLSETPKTIQIPKKYYKCTYAHAVEALRKITGQNFVEYEDWQNWWIEYLKLQNK